MERPLLRALDEVAETGRATCGIRTTRPSHDIPCRRIRRAARARRRAERWFRLAVL